MVTAVYVLLWLISSSAWADAVTKIKRYTSPEEYFDKDNACECMKGSSCAQADCKVTDSGNYATINVSIVSTVFLCDVVYCYICQGGYVLLVSLFLAGLCKNFSTDLVIFTKFIEKVAREPRKKPLHFDGTRDHIALG